MEDNENLARLEQFVEKLIDSHNKLKDENSEIYEQLQAKQQEISELQETLKNLREDRNLMLNRVTGLIDRIDDWEKNLEQEEAGKNSDAENEAGQDSSQKSSSLFSVTAEQSSESAL